MHNKNRAILKLFCKDRKGIIALIIGFIHKNEGNIITLDEFVEPLSKTFFMRVEWTLKGFKINKNNLHKEIKKLALQKNFENSWELFFLDKKPRAAIFVSKYDHCLYDLLLRHKSGELKCDIPLIVSNHKDAKPIADSFKIDFKCIAVNDANRGAAEKEQMAILKEHKIDFIVLARYMRILSSNFIEHYRNRIINIHHSFLPAFKGPKPYHQAYEHGVKIIGATSHFLTEELDCGPIIQQGVTNVTHKDSVQDLIIKGRDIERQVLAEAVKLHIGHRIFVYNNKTVIL